jgi:hypothetical protein
LLWLWFYPSHQTTLHTKHTYIGKYYIPSSSLPTSSQSIPPQSFTTKQAYIPCNPRRKKKEEEVLKIALQHSNNRLLLLLLLQPNSPMDTYLHERCRFQHPLLETGSFLRLQLLFL